MYTRSEPEAQEGVWVSVDLDNVIYNTRIFFLLSLQTSEVTFK